MAFPPAAARWRCAPDEVGSGGAPPLVVRDANGTFVGEPFDLERVILTAEDGRLFAYGLRRSRFSAFALYWTDNSCGADGGIPFGQGISLYALTGVGTNTTAYLPVDPDARSRLVARSLQDASDGSCVDIPNATFNNAFEVEPVLDLTRFVPPFELAR